VYLLSPKGNEDCETVGYAAILIELTGAIDVFACGAEF